jgi:hypothetical protein
MFDVYILRSEPHSNQIYVGSTHDLKSRLVEHNRGKSPPHEQIRAMALSLLRGKGLVLFDCLVKRIALLDVK